MCLLKVQEPRTGCLPCLYVSMWCDEEKNLETGLDLHLAPVFPWILDKSSNFLNPRFLSYKIGAIIPVLPHNTDGPNEGMNGIL